MVVCSGGFSSLKCAGNGNKINSWSMLFDNYYPPLMCSCVSSSRLQTPVFPFTNLPFKPRSPFPEQFQVGNSASASPSENDRASANRSCFCLGNYWSFVHLTAKQNCILDLQVKALKWYCWWRNNCFLHYMGVQEAFPCYIFHIGKFI